MLRPLWKCFQFQGNFKASTDQTASSCKKNQFFPTISFLGTDTKPTSYATRNCYPVQTSETFQSLDRRLDQLIKGTPVSSALSHHLHSRLTFQKQVSPYQSTECVLLTKNAWHCIAMSANRKITILQTIPRSSMFFFTNNK